MDAASKSEIHRSTAIGTTAIYAAALQDHWLATSSGHPNKLGRCTLKSIRQREKWARESRGSQFHQHRQPICLPARLPSLSPFPFPASARAADSQNADSRQPPMVSEQDSLRAGRISAQSPLPNLNAHPQTSSNREPTQRAKQAVYCDVPDVRVDRPAKLTLAQRIGIVEQPRALLTNEEWTVVKEKARVASDGFRADCAICCEPFRDLKQVIGHGIIVTNESTQLK
ncbi:hypothetical protein HDU84_000855 [Entophlyctis sp. JEL0112]|nr:hypothetical protein HDU84_000855 [Entophlyctis sp. JEL0112]